MSAPIITTKIVALPRTTLFRRGDSLYPTFPDADENINVTGQFTEGSLLELPFDFVFGRQSELTGFSIDGKNYQFDDVAAIYGLGTFTVNRNGYYRLSIEGQQIPGT